MTTHMPLDAPGPTGAEPRVSVVVPNYNGRRLLERYFASVVRAVEAHPRAELLVVDDASTDDSVAYLRQAFPHVRILERPTNGGFGEACNTGAAATHGDLLAFIMTDLDVPPGFLAPLVAHFADPDLFAVTPKIVTSAGEEFDASITRLVFKRGMFHIEWPGMQPGYCGNGHAQEVDFAVGGAMVCDRAKFEALGGFDPLYAPYYWEDVDLSYRARKRGWRVLSDPSSVVQHPEPHAVINGLGAGRAGSQRAEQNRLLFTWLHISNRTLLALHTMRLILGTVKRLFRGDAARARSVLRALHQLPQVRARRTTQVGSPAHVHGDLTGSRSEASVPTTAKPDICSRVLQ